MGPRPPKPPRPWRWHSPRSRRSVSLQHPEKHVNYDTLKLRQGGPQTSTADRPQELASFISLAFASAAQPFGVDPLYLTSIRHDKRYTIRPISRPFSPEIQDTQVLDPAPQTHSLRTRGWLRRRTRRFARDPLLATRLFSPVNLDSYNFASATLSSLPSRRDLRRRGNKTQAKRSASQQDAKVRNTCASGQRC